MISGREIRSVIEEDGTLTVSLVDVTVDEPSGDEIIVSVEASPINPSDLSTMIGPANLYSMKYTVEGGVPRLTATVERERLAGVRGRLGLSLLVGNEGAGTVVAAGSEATGLIGKRVGMMGGGMYADYRKISASKVLELPDSVSAAAGASMFINPLTALGLVETAKAEGHAAVVQTAAASNLGQMIQRICKIDDMPLINIVRSQEQENRLKKDRASFVLNSSDNNFFSLLVEAADVTRATAVFDAIGGGKQGSYILQAIEEAAVRRMTTYDRYGSDVFKHLYISGVLDTAPVTLHRLALGNDWSVTSWLLFHFLRKVGPAAEKRLKQRVVDELTTTFASHYSRSISLEEALQPELIRSVQRKSSGEKILITPALT